MDNMFSPCDLNELCVHGVKTKLDLFFTMYACMHVVGT